MLRESNGISSPNPSCTTSMATLCALMERTLVPERTTWRLPLGKSAPTGAVTFVSQPEGEQSARDRRTCQGELTRHRSCAQGSDGVVREVILADTHDTVRLGELSGESFGDNHASDSEADDDDVLEFRHHSERGMKS